MQEQFVILCCENIRAEVDAVLATGDHAPGNRRVLPVPLRPCPFCLEDAQRTGMEGWKQPVQQSACAAAGVPIPLISQRRSGRGQRSSLSMPGHRSSCRKPWSDHYQRSGAYIKLPGRLLRWKQNADCNRLNQSTAREMFGESSTEVLLLDTGVRPGT